MFDYDRFKHFNFNLQALQNVSEMVVEKKCLQMTKNSRIRCRRDLTLHDSSFQTRMQQQLGKLGRRQLTTLYDERSVMRLTLSENFLSIRGPKTERTRWRGTAVLYSANI